MITAFDPQNAPRSADEDMKTKPATPRPTPTSTSVDDFDLAFRSMLDRSYDAFLLLRPLKQARDLVDLVLLDANQTARGMFKLEEGDIGRNTSALNHQHFGPVLGAYRDLMRSGETQRFALVLNNTLVESELYCPCGNLLVLAIVRKRRPHKTAHHSAENSLETFVENAPDAIFVADIDGRFIHANPAGCEILGYRKQEILNMSLLDLIPDANSQRLLLEKRLLLSGEPLTSEWLIRRKDGSDIPVEVSAKILSDGRWLGFVREISERKRTERELKLSAAVFNNAREAIVIADANRKVVAVNAAYSELTGYRERAVLEREIADFRSGKHDENFYQTLWQRVNSEGFWRGEIWNRRKNGEVYPSWQNISVVRDDKGNISHYVFIISDISEKKAVESKLSYLAHHDALTGLANRIAFNANLERALEHAKRNDSKVALLFIDLNDFKQVNDTYGHLAGDQLLQIAADRLRRCVRGEDAVARMGGDEFTIVLDNISDEKDAIKVAKKVLQTMELPVRLTTGEVELGLSIGISIFPQHGQSVNDITRAADAAMYSAKKQGSCSYQVFIG